VRVVSVLLAAGAALNSRDRVSAVRDEDRSESFQTGKTLLHSACQGGHVEMVLMMLATGAALESRDQVSAVRE
jgi:ankyrin repeat protein